jgi:copper chaperone CopZ
MGKPVKGLVKLGVTVVLALAIGAGGVFALNQPLSVINPDAVVVLKSRGISCGSCAGRIAQEIDAKPGVAGVEVDVDAGQVMIAVDSKTARPEGLAETVTALGYKSSILQVLSREQYQAMTGGKAAPRTANADGCGCCNRN